MQSNCSVKVLYAHSEFEQKHFRMKRLIAAFFLNWYIPKDSLVGTMGFGGSLTTRGESTDSRLEQTKVSIWSVCT